MARLRKASRSRKAEGMRRLSREKWILVLGGESGLLGGAKRSDNVPVKSRASVDARAIMETCVLAVPAVGARILPSPSTRS